MKNIIVTNTQRRADDDSTTVGPTISDLTEYRIFTPATEHLIRHLTGNTRAFAEACYDCNSVADLKQLHAGIVDMVDCQDWDLSPIQWMVAVSAALAERKSEL
jgi:hypothetical protein